MDFNQAPKDFNPPWAYNAAAPALVEIRRGVLYTGLEYDTLRALLRVGTLIAAWAAIGPKLFFGRGDGPYVPYDRDAVDQNNECKVSKRGWPWSWGDDVWAVLEWDAQPLALHFNPDGCEVYLGTPGARPLQSCIAMGKHVLAWAQKEAGEHVAMIYPPHKEFLSEAEQGH